MGSLCMDPASPPDGMDVSPMLDPSLPAMLKWYSKALRRKDESLEAMLNRVEGWIIQQLTASHVDHEVAEHFSKSTKE